MPEIICPHCKNPIYDEEALFCHFCGGSLRRSSRGMCGPIKYGRFRIITAALVLTLVVIWVILTLR